MNKQTSYSIIKIKTCCAKKADVEMEKKCCKNTKVKVEKIKDNYTASHYSKIKPPQLSFFIITYIQSSFFSFTTHQCALPSSNHEPPDKKVPFAILYQSFLI